jgi:hypothetical protein
VPGAKRANKGLRPVTHLTAVGHVVVKRRVWQRSEGGLDVPADDWLNEDAARISRGARERCCRIGCHPQGFVHSADDLKRLAGISVSAERLRQIVEGEGHDLTRQRQSGALVPTWRGSDCRVETPASGDRGAGTGVTAGAGGRAGVGAGATTMSRVRQGAWPTRLYIGIDGFMAPMVTEAEKQKRRDTRNRGRRKRKHRRSRLGRGYRERYKEFKLTAFYDQERVHRHVLATGSGPEEVGRLLRRESRRLALPEVDEVVAIVDGAPWIRTQLERFAGCDHIGLDYYHFSEHVAEAARTCFGEGTPAAEAWRHKLIGLAFENGVDELLDEVTRQRATLRSPSKRAALSRLRHYIGERTAMIRYAENRARGWDIGSGPTESLCKTMARRLKGAGMRWDPAGADAVLSLTALQDSDAWDRYWGITGHEN